VDIREGKISVDSVNLGQVSPSLIRKKCFITIAQDPFVIDQASLRFNLNVSDHERAMNYSFVANSVNRW
jgi:ABC-type bacteriocin/lantibiotic exporter with double-glycine peptidase domain